MQTLPLLQGGKLLCHVPSVFSRVRLDVRLQYKNGGSTQNALKTLWEEGGVQRLYRGVSFALVQGPLSRCVLH